MFYCLVAVVLHQSVGSPPGAPAVAAMLANILFFSSVALWVVADARRRRCPLAYDFGSFVFFAWWSVAPIYLLSTRGWRALIPFAYFVLLYLAASVFGNIPAWLSAIS